jgi:GNAT superfamily N-acetyltransferase
VSASDRLGGVKIRRLEERDLAEADKILRQAFGTFLGLPDPMDFMGDGDYVRTRWAADPSAALAAEVDGDLVGTNFVTRWGSVGYFGPLTVAPSVWDRGVARSLLDATMAVFDEWGVRHRGLFTFGHSPKHLFLYQSYGFWPRYLTAVLAKPALLPSADWTAFSSLPDREEGLDAAAAVTDSVFAGLDVRREIGAVLRQGLGETVMVYEGRDLAAFGVCHIGAGTEAGSGRCVVKFGAARAGDQAGQRFSRLLDACEGFASSHGASTVVAGVSTGRRGAYRQMLNRGYRASSIGVTLHQPDVDAYHHAEAYVIDDWR